MSKNIEVVIKQFKGIATDNRNEQHYWETRPNPNSNTLAYAQKACESAEYHEQIVAMLEELKARREADRWIPVSERPPKVSGYYLVTRTGNSGKGYIRRSFYDVSLKEWDESRVIAWKPLPEAYKESEDK